LAQTLQYAAAHREQANASTRKWYAANRERVAEYQRQYRSANRERLADRNRAYREVTRDHRVEYQRRYARGRRSADPVYKLTHQLRVRLRSAVRRNLRSGSAVRDLGMPVAEFKARLESQFLPGMTWENWGSGEGTWQIDHVFPLAAADLSDRAQLLAVCNYRNLQPLWFADNVAKGDAVSPEAQSLFDGLVLTFRQEVADDQADVQ
jgi:hypothetical protein